MKKIILIILFSLVSLMASAPMCTINKNDYYTEVHRYNDLYKSVIESIKTFEGLKLNAYYCPAGYKTIGYGHLIRDYEAIGDSITIEKADTLLIKDFEESITTVIDMLDFDRYKNCDKVFALAHFVFNIGSGGFEKSTLRHLIKEDKSIDKEMLKWIHYRDTSNKLITSNNLKNMRLYEITLYNR